MTPAASRQPPAASTGVGVRFAQGEAAMVSAGRRGAIAILPGWYGDNTHKLLFKVEGYNRSADPINLGPENLTLGLDTGAALPVHDFDGLRHEAALGDAEQQRVLATVEAAVGVYTAHKVGRRHPDRGRALMEDVSNAYDDQLHSLGENLMRRVASLRFVLQATTIDPGATGAAGS